MGRYAIWLVSIYGDPVGAWLTRYDPDFWQEGAAATGEIVASEHLDDAMTFDSVEEAYRFYGTQSKRMPYGSNGEPNRPLTAFTVEVYDVGGEPPHGRDEPGKNP